MFPRGAWEQGCRASFALPCSHAPAWECRLRRSASVCPVTWPIDSARVPRSSWSSFPRSRVGMPSSTLSVGVSGHVADRPGPRSQVLVVLVPTLPRGNAVFDAQRRCVRSRVRSPRPAFPGPRGPRSHAPAWECRLRRSASVCPVTWPIASARVPTLPRENGVFDALLSMNSTISRGAIQSTIGVSDAPRAGLFKADSSPIWRTFKNISRKSTFLCPAPASVRQLKGIDTVPSDPPSVAVDATSRTLGLSEHPLLI